MALISLSISSPERASFIVELCSLTIGNSADAFGNLLRISFSTLAKSLRVSKSKCLVCDVFDFFADSWSRIWPTLRVRNQDLDKTLKRFSRPEWHLQSQAFARSFTRRATTSSFRFCCFFPNREDCCKRSQLTISFGPSLRRFLIASRLWVFDWDPVFCFFFFAFLLLPLGSLSGTDSGLVSVVLFCVVLSFTLLCEVLLLTSNISDFLSLCTFCTSCSTRTLLLAFLVFRLRFWPCFLVLVWLPPSPFEPFGISFWGNISPLLSATPDVPVSTFFWSPLVPCFFILSCLVGSSRFLVAPFDWPLWVNFFCLLSLPVAIFCSFLVCEPFCPCFWISSSWTMPSSPATRASSCDFSLDKELSIPFKAIFLLPSGVSCRRLCSFCRILEWFALSFPVASFCGGAFSSLLTALLTFSSRLARGRRFLRLRVPFCRPVSSGASSWMLFDEGCFTASVWLVAPTVGLFSSWRFLPRLNLRLPLWAFSLVSFCAIVSPWALFGEGLVGMLAAESWGFGVWLLVEETLSWLGFCFGWMWPPQSREESIDLKHKVIS